MGINGPTNTYHGILINKSFNDHGFPESFTLFAKRQSKDSDWIIFGIEVDPKDVSAIITKI